MRRINEKREKKTYLKTTNCMDKYNHLTTFNKLKLNK